MRFYLTYGDSPSAARLRRTGSFNRYDNGSSNTEMEGRICSGRHDWMPLDLFTIFVTRGQGYSKIRVYKISDDS